MYDAVRWTLLVLLFAGLVGAWLWSRRQAAGRALAGKEAGPKFRVLQKRWVDQKTGICLIEADERQYLLAYTVGGSVSWQPLEPPPATVSAKPTLSEASHEMVSNRRSGLRTRRPTRAKFSPSRLTQAEPVSV